MSLVPLKKYLQKNHVVLCGVAWVSLLVVLGVLGGKSSEGEYTVLKQNGYQRVDIGYRMAHSASCGRQEPAITFDALDPKGSLVHGVVCKDTSDGYSIHLD